jgi:hypothetical protein
VRCSPWGPDAARYAAAAGRIYHPDRDRRKDAAHGSDRFDARPVRSYAGPRGPPVSGPNRAGGQPNVTASEFAFLALGLVLGVAAGAALVEVARSRPAAPREVRVTVAPNSIRSRASTLADGPQTNGDDGPARGGPADRRWVDRDEDESPDEPDDPPAGGSTASSTPDAGHVDEAGAAREPAEHSSGSRTSVPFVLQPATAGPGGPFLAAGNGRPPEAIPIAASRQPQMRSGGPSLTASSRPLTRRSMRRP